MSKRPGPKEIKGHAGKTYGSTEIQKLTGLSKMQVIHLTQTRVIQPFRDARGRGRRRVYNWQNLVEYMICRELYKIDMSPFRMLGIIESLNLPAIKKGSGFISFWEMYENDPELKLKFFVIHFDKKDGENYAFADTQTMGKVLKKGDFDSFTLINLQRLIEEAL